jgi:Flp pilus assembly protein TadB
LISFGWSHSEKVLTFYGERIHQDYGFINPIIKWAILFVISVKFILATMVFLMNRWAIFKNIKLKQEQISEYALKKFVDQGGELPRSQNKKSGILKDLSQPLFLMSLVFTFVFLFVTQPKPSLMVWYLMRPIGIYLLISFCLRSPAFLQFLDQKTQSFKILRPIHERAQKLKIYLLQNK